MDTELKITSIETGEKIPIADSAVLAEGDVIVPDIKPDVAKIMSVEADAVVKKTERTGNALKVSGTVFVNIIYLPETAEDEKAGICAINTRFDFTDEIKAESPNAKITAEALVRHVDFSLVNSRKLYLKIYVGLSACAFEKRKIEFLDNAENSQMLEVKKNSIGLYSIIDNTTKEIIVSENIDIPKSKGDIGEILKLSATAYGAECKLMTNKILVKGIMGVTMLYITADSDEELETVEAEIPFSDVFDAEGITEDSLCNVRFNIKDYYFNVKNDINENPRIVAFEALVDVNIFASEIIDAQITEDCYIPGQSCSVEKKQLSGYEIKQEGSGKVNIKERITFESRNIQDVYSCTVKPVISEQTLTEYGMQVSGIAVCNIIAKTNDDTVVFETREIPFQYSADANITGENAMAECTASVLSKNYNISGGDVEVYIILEMYSKILEPISFSAAISCTEEEETEVQKSAMLVIYFVQNGDDLWEIAKRYKITPQKICAANNLGEKDKICAGMKLLIPTA